MLLGIGPIFIPRSCHSVHGTKSGVGRKQKNITREDAKNNFSSWSSCVGAQVKI
jgi:hypothetical protein